MIDFKIPKESPQELLLYIWKIIGLPYITKEDLSHYIPFKLSLLPPEKTKIFIRKCLDNNFLKINLDNTISLSDDLERKFKSWQKKSKENIKKKESIFRDGVKTLKKFEDNQKSKLNILLKIFLDKGTINRAVSISSDSIKILELNPNKGILKAEILGSKNESYLIEISLKNKTIKHNCHDYLERRAPKKKFCKHIAKLFLDLKENNKEFIVSILNDIADSVNNWNFIN